MPEYKKFAKMSFEGGSCGLIKSLEDRVENACFKEHRTCCTEQG